MLFGPRMRGPGSGACARPEGRTCAALSGSRMREPGDRRMRRSLPQRGILGSPKGLYGSGPSGEPFPVGPS